MATASGGLPAEAQDEFRAGYRSAHPLPADVATNRWLPLRALWDIGDWLAMAPVMGREVTLTPEETERFLAPVAEQWRAPVG